MYEIRCEREGQVLSRGTGWIPADRPDVVISAFHVVGSSTAEKFWHEQESDDIHYTLGHDDEATSLCPLCFDNDADVAVLECRSPLGRLKRLQLADDIAKESRWEATGWPALVTRQQFTLTGKIIRLQRGDTQLQLFVDQGAGQTFRDEDNSVWGGMSGSAVSVEGEVVGLFTSVIPFIETKTAFAATVVPVRRLLALCLAGDELTSLLRRLDWDSERLKLLYLRFQSQLCGGIAGVLSPQSNREELFELLRRTALRSGVGGFDSLLKILVEDDPNANFNGIRTALQAAMLQGLRHYQDLIGHWLPRARGTNSTEAWYFTGRSRALREIAAWLKNGNSVKRAMVLTGAPGAGKSALLSRVVILTDPSYLAEVTRSGNLKDVDEDTIPPVNAITIAIHAKGKTLPDVVRQIGRVVDFDTSDPHRLAEHLGMSGAWRTIVFDALDEATERDEIAGELLGKLSRLSNVRLLVGTRRRGHTEGGTLGVNIIANDIVEIDLDRSEYLGETDIARYVKRRLLAFNDPSVASRYSDQSQELVLAVAQEVAKKANKNFLVAQVVSGNLIDAREPIRLSDENWRERIPDGVNGAFDQFIARFNDRNRFALDGQRIKELLRPLAYSDGVGLPREEAGIDLWARLATAISHREWVEGDIDVVLMEAGDYIVEQLEGGRAVFRLYHEKFAEYLRKGTRDRLINARITKELVRLTPVRADGVGREWLRAPAYARTQLASHAARAGMLGELINDPLYLLAADPTRLVLAIAGGTNELPQEIVHTYQNVLHHLHSKPIIEAASYLEMTARQCRAAELAEHTAQLPFNRRWSVLWADWRQITSRVIGQHKKSVCAVAIADLNGRPVVVSGGADRTIKAWDLATGRAVGRVISEHESWVSSVVSAQHQGGPVIISGSWDHTVGVWDLATGCALYPRIVHEQCVHAVAVAQREKRQVIVTGGDDGTIRLWDLATGKAAGSPFIGHKGAVNALAAGQIENRPVIISGSTDDTIRIWDLVTAEQIGPPLQGDMTNPRAVAVTEFGGRLVIVCDDELTTVAAWDLVERRPAGQPLKYNYEHGYISGVAAGELDGRAVIVTGTSNDYAVRIWDLASGDSVGEPLVGHFGKITAVALVRSGDRRVIVSASEDGTVRSWNWVPTEGIGRSPDHHARATRTVLAAPFEDRTVIVDENLRVRDVVNGNSLGLSFDQSPVRLLATGMLGSRPVVAFSEHWYLHVRDLMTGEPIGKPFTEHIGPPTAAVFGQLEGQTVIVSAGEDEEVHIWDLFTGKPIGKPLVGHTRWITSIAMAEIECRPVVVFGSWDQSVRVWDLERGELLGEPLYGISPVKNMDVVQLNGLPVVVCGGADQTVLVWDLSSGRRIGRPLTDYKDRDVTEWENWRNMGAVATLQLGERILIVTGNTDATLRVWEFDSESFSLKMEIEVGTQIYAIVPFHSGIVVCGEMGLMTVQLRME